VPPLRTARLSLLLCLPACAAAAPAFIGAGAASLAFAHVGNRVLELAAPLSLGLHAIQLAPGRRLPRSDPVTEPALDLQLLLHHLPQPDQARHAVGRHIQPDGAPAALIGALLDDGEGAGLIPPFLT